MGPFGPGCRALAVAVHLETWALRTLFLLFFVGSLLCEGTRSVALAQAGGPADAGPRPERISPHEVRIGTMIIDESRRCLKVPGRVNMDAGPVEVLACTPTGKVHESVLVVDVPPYVLQVGLLLLGLRPSASQDSADRVAVRVIHDEGPPIPAERLLVDARTGANLEESGWWFRGSRVLRGVFTAEVSGTLVATYADPSAILDNPQDSATNDEIISINQKLVPPKGDSVVVEFSKWTGRKIRRSLGELGGAAGAGSAAAMPSMAYVSSNAPSDSLPVAGMTPPVVVTASRLGQLLQEYPGSVLILDRDDLEALPVSQTCDLLEVVPGLHLFDATANGSRPIIAPRGFTGAGEGEYVELLVDGIPANELQRGIADFNLLPLSQLARFEILRGPASAVYGDLATAGVVQLESRPTTSPWFTIRGGAYGSLAAEAGSGYARSSGYLGGNASWLLADGWRDNSRWQEGKLFGRGAMTLGKQVLGITALATFSDVGNPGPVPREWLVQQPESAFFPRDGEESTRVLAGLQVVGPLLGPVGHTSRVYVRTRDADVTRTLAAAMNMTEERDETLDERALGAELRTLSRLWHERQLLQVGLECEKGTLEDVYFEASGTSIAAGGDVGRLKIAPYVQSVTDLGRGFDFSLGGRYDYFHLSFDQTAGGQARARRTMDRFTGRAGLNWKWHAGNVYALASGLFKIPTLEQLYDQRHPLGLPLSNPDLVPQHGTSFELGTRWQPDKATSAELVFYRIRMHDEIVFDPSTFVYQNIGKSDHDGIEMALMRRWAKRFTTRVVYTWTKGIFRSGEASGNRINGIPEHRGVVALDVTLPLDLHLGGSVEVNSSQYLDEANSRELRAYGVSVIQLWHENGPVRSYLQVENLLDQRFGTSGYVLPFDGTELIYPGRPRRFTIGVEVFP